MLDEFKKGILKSGNPSNFFNNLKEMGQLGHSFEELDLSSDYFYNQTMDKVDNLAKNKEKLPNYEAIVVSTIFENSDYSQLDNSNKTRTFLEKHTKERERAINNFVWGSGEKGYNADYTDAMFAIDKSSLELVDMAKYKDIDYGSELSSKYDSLKDDYLKAKENFVSGKELIEIGFKPGKEFGEKIEDAKRMAFHGYDKEKIKNILLKEK